MIQQAAATPLRLDSQAVSSALGFIQEGADRSCSTHLRSIEFLFLDFLQQLTEKLLQLFCTPGSLTAPDPLP